MGDGGWGMGDGGWGMGDGGWGMGDGEFMAQISGTFRLKWVGLTIAIAAV